MSNTVKVKDLQIGDKVKRRSFGVIRYSTLVDKEERSNLYDLKFTNTTGSASHFSFMEPEFEFMKWDGKKVKCKTCGK